MQPTRSQAQAGHGDAAPVAAHAPLIDHLGYARLLGQVDLFAGLDKVTLAKLAAYLQPLSYQAGAIIFHQAEPGDAFYLVASGAVGVYTADKSGTGETRLEVLRAGEPFGEMALLTNSPRTASIKAESDCEVLRLERGAFLDLVRQQPGVALAIAATLSRRLARQLDPPSELDDELAAAALPGAGEGTLAAAAAVAVARPRWRPGRAALALTAAIVMLGVGWALPPPTGMSAAAWHALVVLLAALPALALDAMLEGVLALLLAGAWVLLGITPAAVALSGFASTSWVLVVAVLVIGAAITASGVLYRLSLLTITHIRGGFAGEVTALSLTGVLVGPAVPNATSRVIIIAPMMKELVEALGYRPNSKAATGIAMAVLIGFGQMGAVVLTSSTTAVLVAAVLPVEAQRDLNWITWALYGAPANIILFVGMLASLLWLYRPAPGDRRLTGDRATLLDCNRRCSARCRVTRRSRSASASACSPASSRSPCTASIRPGWRYWRPACWRRRASSPPIRCAP